MSGTLRVSEIYRSIQGESSHAGRPCGFVRLTGCHLRCVWCDSVFSFTDGETLSVDEVARRTFALGTRLVEVTGGEPLLQPAVHDLMTRLLDAGLEVLLETSGNLDLSAVDPRVIKIVDVKCPASGESHRNHWPALEQLGPLDELKFVIADRADYEWTRTTIRERSLADVATLLVGCVDGALAPERLVDWVLADGLPVRFQLQLHKVLWPDDVRGV